MSRLDEIEARLNAATKVNDPKSWKENALAGAFLHRTDVAMLSHAQTDLTALLAVARAAEIVRTIVLHDGQKPNVTFELYDAYKVLFGALDALDAKEADSETTTTTD